MALSETVTIDCLAMACKLGCRCLVITDPPHGVILRDFSPEEPALSEVEGISRIPARFIVRTRFTPGPSQLRMAPVWDGYIRITSLRMFSAPKQGRTQNPAQSGENNESNQGADQSGCQEQDDSLGRFEEFHGLLGLRVWIASGGLFD